MPDEHELRSALEAQLGTFGCFVLRMTCVRRPDSGSQDSPPVVLKRLWIRGVVLLLLVLGVGFWIESISWNPASTLGGWEVVLSGLVYSSIMFNVIWVVWALARGTLAAKLLARPATPPRP